MTATHIVEPGEHLGIIARKFGFTNFSPLWEHPENAQLKALRKDPMQLAPGDEVFVPDRVQLIFERATDSSHDFRVLVDTVSLSLRLLALDGTPRKNETVIVRVEAPETDGASQQSERQLTTDGDGKLTVELATHVGSGTITIDGVELPLQIGGLDPIDTESGVAQRLANMGYFVLGDDTAIEEDELRFAIEDFQVDNELEVTGERSDIESNLQEVFGS